MEQESILDTIVGYIVSFGHWVVETFHHFMFWAFPNFMRFHESAIAIYGDHQCTGLNEIKSFLSESLRSIGDAQHLLTNIQIEVNEDNASSTSYLSSLQMINDINPMPSQVWGQYKDNLIKDNGVWKITRKELKIFFSS